MRGIFLVGELAAGHDVALSYSLVAMYSTSNCLFSAWPEYIISRPELKAYVHYDQKCCGLVPYLWGSPRHLVCCGDWLGWMLFHLLVTRFYFTATLCQTNVFHGMVFLT